MTVSSRRTCAARRDAGRKLLVPYVTGGLGSGWLDVVRAVADAGADAIEIGIPFSDPVMDGLTIQEASQRALDLGATPGRDHRRRRRRSTSTSRSSVMTYNNPVGHMGYQRFAAALADAGIAGAIVPDLPLDELDGWADAADAAGVETVLLAAPTTPDDRLVAHLRALRGFVYGVSLHGRHRRAGGAGEPGRRDGPAAQGGHRQAGAARRRDLQRRAGGRGGAVRRRRDRRQRARARGCSTAAGPTAAHAFVAELRAALDARLATGMIKYLGSKRRLVPVLTRLCEAADARTALDLFTGTTRVAQAFKRAGARVTAVDTARYSEVFARRYVATDADAVDRRRARDADRRPRTRCPGEPGLLHRHVLRAVALLPAVQRRARRRDPRRHRARPRRHRRSTRSCSPACIEAADRVDSTTGVQMAYVKQWAPRSYAPLDAARPGAARRAPGAAVRGDALDVAADARRRATSPTSTRRTTSTATSPTTTCGRRSWRGTRPSTTASRASAIDARDDVDQERVQPPAR